MTRNSTPRTVYTQIFHKISEDIANGVYQKGDMIPTQNELAEAFGAKGYRATTPAEFKVAFTDAMKQQGPSWIDCRIDKDEKVLPMIPGGGTIEDIIME